jgi:hypothetical protein
VFLKPVTITNSKSKQYTRRGIIPHAKLNFTEVAFIGLREESRTAIRLIIPQSFPSPEEYLAIRRPSRRSEGISLKRGTDQISLRRFRTYLISDISPQPRMFCKVCAVERFLLSRVKMSTLWRMGGRDVYLIGDC